MSFLAVFEYFIKIMIRAQRIITKRTPINIGKNIGENNDAIPNAMTAKRINPILALLIVSLPEFEEY